MWFATIFRTFWGGSSASYGDFVRGKVVDVALEGTFVSGLTNLSVVNLYNMNLQNETDLSSKLPAHAWRLSLRNDLITSFPYDESSFSALQILYVRARLCLELIDCRDDQFANGVGCG